MAAHCVRLDLCDDDVNDAGRMKREHKRHDPGFLIIAGFKLIKGVLLLATGIGALSLLHGDLLALVARWAEAMQVSTQNRLLHKLLQELGLVHPRQIVIFSAVTFSYAALLLTEGVGLWLEKVWAEYLTTIVTACFIPFEIYELTKRVTPTRILLLLVNVAVVVYLSWRLRLARRRA